MKPDIEERIKKDFDKEYLLAIDLLFVFEAEEGLNPRISRCIGHLAEGDISKSEAAIQNAKTDWRDVIREAESMPFEFNQPFR